MPKRSLAEQRRLSVLNSRSVVLVVRQFPRTVYVHWHGHHRRKRGFSLPAKASIPVSLAIEVRPGKRPCTPG